MDYTFYSSRVKIHMISITLDFVELLDGVAVLDESGQSVDGVRRRRDHVARVQGLSARLRHSCQGPRILSNETINHIKRVIKTGRKKLYLWYDDDFLGEVQHGSDEIGVESHEG